MKRPCYLYRLYDGRDQLLYVGISLSGLKRLGEHLGEKDWAPTVRRTTIETFATRDEAAAAEVAAIKSERPLHNVQHNGRPARRTADRDGALANVLATGYFGRNIRSDLMPDLCHDVCEVRTEEFGPIYYPYKWSDGLAFYTCMYGHAWTCGWGHSSTGEDPTWGVHVVPYTARGHLQYPRAFYACPGCGRTHNSPAEDGWTDAGCGRTAGYYLLELDTYSGLDLDWRYTLSLVSGPGTVGRAALREYRDQTMRVAWEHLDSLRSVSA